VVFPPEGLYSRCPSGNQPHRAALQIKQREISRIPVRVFGVFRGENLIS
jgi:hypothetical protein